MSDDYIDIYKNISRIFTKKNNLRIIVATKPKSMPLVPNTLEDFLDESFAELNHDGNTIYMSKFLVTQALYKSWMGTNPSNFKGEQLPVENVSWYDAAEFCNRLSEQFKETREKKRYIRDKEKRLIEDITKKGFRLPTEAEWEYAARGGKDGKGFDYSGSNNIDEVAWYWENSDRRTHPVGQLKPNELGLFDMSGNVWEWCEDWRDNDKTSRVLRGGSWDLNAFNCRVSIRCYSHPDIRLGNFGFRLVCSL